MSCELKAALTNLNSLLCHISIVSSVQIAALCDNDRVVTVCSNNTCYVHVCKQMSIATALIIHT